MQCPEWAISLAGRSTRRLVRVSENRPNAALRELGALLLAARKRSGKSQRAVAAEAGFRAHSRISEFENALVIGTSDEYERLLDALGSSPRERERAEALASQAAGGSSVLQVGPAVIDETLVQLLDYESIARRITVTAPLLPPGLLQTAEFARAIYGDSSSAKTRVALRVLRREILTRRSPVELRAFIDSEALLRPVVTKDQLVDQLGHILDLAALPNVSIQVVSSTTPGYHPMLSGQFELIEFPSASPVVLLDHYHASVFLRDPADVAVYEEAAEHLRKEVAMSPEDSVGLIAEIVNGWETT